MITLYTLRTMDLTDHAIHIVPSKNTPTLGPCGPAAGQEMRFATANSKVSFNFYARFWNKIVVDSFVQSPFNKQ